MNLCPKHKTTILVWVIQAFFGSISPNFARRLSFISLIRPRKQDNAYARHFKFTEFEKDIEPFIQYRALYPFPILFLNSSSCPTESRGPSTFKAIFSLQCQANEHHHSATKRGDIPIRRQSYTDRRRERDVLQASEGKSSEIGCSSSKLHNAQIVNKSQLNRVIWTKIINHYGTTTISKSKFQ